MMGGKHLRVTTSTTGIAVNGTNRWRHSTSGRMVLSNLTKLTIRNGNVKRPWKIHGHTSLWLTKEQVHGRVTSGRKAKRNHFNRQRYTHSQQVKAIGWQQPPVTPPTSGRRVTGAHVRTGIMNGFMMATTATNSTHDVVIRNGIAKPQGNIHGHKEVTPTQKQLQARVMNGWAMIQRCIRRKSANKAHRSHQP